MFGNENMNNSTNNKLYKSSISFAQFQFKDIQISSTKISYLFYERLSHDRSLIVYMIPNNFVQRGIFVKLYQNQEKMKTNTSYKSPKVYLDIGCFHVDQESM